ncbi:MAG: hypothetical protein MUO40_10625 [Anaerolineaceae bacterium]|nr:hypothetical protein [Anaerolineaceae bacterium]
MIDLGLKESYLIDAEGKRIGVLLSMSDYQKLISRLEELDAFRSANDFNIVDELILDGIERSVDTMPSFRQRRGPGGMIVI